MENFNITTKGKSVKALVGNPAKTDTETTLSAYLEQLFALTEALPAEFGDTAKVQAHNCRAAEILLDEKWLRTLKKTLNGEICTGEVNDASAKKNPADKVHLAALELLESLGDTTPTLRLHAAEMLVALGYFDGLMDQYLVLARDRGKSYGRIYDRAEEINQTKSIVRGFATFDMIMHELESCLVIDNYDDFVKRWRKATADLKLELIALIFGDDESEAKRFTQGPLYKKARKLYPKDDLARCDFLDLYWEDFVCNTYDQIVSCMERMEKRNRLLEFLARIVEA